MSSPPSFVDTTSRSARRCSSLSIRSSQDRFRDTALPRPRCLGNSLACENRLSDELVFSVVQSLLGCTTDVHSVVRKQSLRGLGNVLLRQDTADDLTHQVVPAACRGLPGTETEGQNHGLRCGGFVLTVHQGRHCLSISSDPLTSRASWLLSHFNKFVVMCARARLCFVAKTHGGVWAVLPDVCVVRENLEIVNVFPLTLQISISFRRMS